MNRNFTYFIGLTVLSTVIYLGAESGVTRMPAGPQNFASLALALFALWVVFDFVIKVIYRLAGVTNKLMEKSPPRLSHQQAAVVNRYWIAWLSASLFTGVTYTLLLQRSQWKSALITAGVAIVVVVLALANSKQKIAGHTKNEIFK